MIDVYNSSTLTFEDVTISGLGLSPDNLRCRTQDGSIVFKDSELVLSHEYTFSYGSILFDQDVKITGTKTFVYASAMGSTINSESQLYLDMGVGFSYDPPTDNRDLLIMTDTSSRLFCNGCTLYSTPTGLRLTNGIVLFDNKATLSAQGQNSSESISFGNVDL